MAGMSASALNSALTMLSCHTPGSGPPGSPNSGCSLAVPAWASSMLADNAPSSISASLKVSATASVASIFSASQVIALPCPWGSLGFLLFRQLVFQIMDAGAALEEGGIAQQVLMQRNIGADALH